MTEIWEEIDRNIIAVGTLILVAPQLTGEEEQINKDIYSEY
jgi:hypothetical protein